MLLLGTLFWETGAGTPAPPPPPADTTPPPRGTVPWLSDLGARRTKRDISRERERYGIQDELALAAIAEVAARQAERLELDEQKRFEELSRELELRRIEWDARYLEALNVMRERLIGEEIAALMHRKLRDEEDILVLMMMAAGITI